MSNQHIYHNTPLFQSHSLHQIAGKEIYYKMDCYQPSGSFKIRGMETLALHLQREGHQKLLASSGGNAGYSLAYVGRELGLSIKVIVPQTTSEFMVNKIRALDADVEIFGKDWNETHEYALNLSVTDNIPYVPPFDHPLLWEGHASIIDECAQVMDPPDQVVVAIGGGGLMLGVMEGLKRNHWENTHLIAAETTGAASFAECLKTGEWASLDRIDTVATSLGARKVAQQLFENIQKFDLTSHVVTDEVALSACDHFLQEYNVLVEPACGASLSFAYDANPSGKTLVIVCGGVNMSLTSFLSYRKEI